MKTDNALRTRARAIAESHFYSDDECETAWEPFEDYPDAWLQEQVRDLEHTIYHALKWVNQKQSWTEEEFNTEIEGFKIQKIDHKEKK